MNVSITFHNKTTRITSATVILDGRTIELKGEDAKELARMANSDNPGIKNYIESLVCIE